VVRRAHNDSSVGARSRECTDIASGGPETRGQRIANRRMHLGWPPTRERRRPVSVDATGHTAPRHERPLPCRPLLALAVGRGENDVGNVLLRRILLEDEHVEQGREQSSKWYREQGGEATEDDTCGKDGDEDDEG
jgi:hypothetical protein